MTAAGSATPIAPPTGDGQTSNGLPSPSWTAGTAPIQACGQGCLPVARVMSPQGVSSATARFLGCSSVSGQLQKLVTGIFSSPPLALGPPCGGQRFEAGHRAPDKAGRLRDVDRVSGCWHKQSSLSPAVAPLAELIQPKVLGAVRRARPNRRLLQSALAFRAPSLSQRVDATSVETS